MNRKQTLAWIERKRFKQKIRSDNDYIKWYIKRYPKARSKPLLIN